MDRSLQDIKEEIKIRTDIVELIGSYTRLKRTGKNWTGLCPFHADKRPSFNVSPQLGIYKCFSCGESGDVFTFVEKKENLDFREAMEFLARRAGIAFEWKPGDRERASEREQMIELNRIAVRFFQERLTQSQDAKDYLARRGILKETQDRFDIGFAPPDWEALTFYLQHHRADLRLAAKIGLIKARTPEGSGHYDTFRNRLMFPIHDVNGSVIAFGGRALGDDPAKYLNSEQSLLFDKSRTLYGLYFARKKLSGDTPAVFVEGYMDVVTAHQAGFLQCVATLGTSMTEDHARILGRYNPRVIICYDGDAAGIKATMRGAAVWDGIGVEGAEVRVARLPADDDPDSMLRRGDTARFQKSLDDAVPLADFQIDLAKRDHDLHTPDGRAEALAQVIPIIASVRSETMANRYIVGVVDLHPQHGTLGIDWAIRQITQDVENCRTRMRNGERPRDRGYPLTEQTNRAPLAQQPAPPTYRPPNKESWGRSGWPMTENVTRRGEGDPGRGGGYGGRGRERLPAGPTGNAAPPPLEAPTLTGAEKAERQLLRACFSGEWRSHILARLQTDTLATSLGRRLFEWIACTPAGEDGSIDPQILLRRAQDEAAATAPAESHEAAVEADLPPPFPTDAPSGSFASGSPNSTQKMYDFIINVLEDSPFLVSNEKLNEPAVNGCITRLLKDRGEREKRALKEKFLLQDSEAREEFRTVVDQMTRKIREMHGSTPEDEGP